MIENREEDSNHSKKEIREQEHKAETEKQRKRKQTFHGEYKSRVAVQASLRCQPCQVKVGQERGRR